MIFLVKSQNYPTNKQNRLIKVSVWKTIIEIWLGYEQKVYNLEEFFSEEFCLSLNVKVNWTLIPSSFSEQTQYLARRPLKNLYLKKNDFSLSADTTLLSLKLEYTRKKLVNNIKRGLCSSRTSCAGSVTERGKKVKAKHELCPLTHDFR